MIARGGLENVASDGDEAGGEAGDGPASRRRPSTMRPADTSGWPGRAAAAQGAALMKDAVSAGQLFPHDYHHTRNAHHGPLVSI